MNNDVARWRGAKNRAQGETLESQIEAACVVYRARGIADIEKTPEPMRVLRPLENGQFVACFSKKAQPDFQGTLANGRAVMFEAKSTRTGKMSQSVVTEEQTKRLERHARMGALCFVVVSFDNLYARVPWADWCNMRDLFGHKYISKEEASRYRIGFNKNGVLGFLE